MASQVPSDEPKDSLKTFVFSTKNDDFVDDEKLEIVIPEVGYFVDGNDWFEGGDFGICTSRCRDGMYIMLIGFLLFTLSSFSSLVIRSTHGLPRRSSLGKSTGISIFWNLIEIPKSISQVPMDSSWEFHQQTNSGDRLRHWYAPHFLSNWIPFQLTNHLSQHFQHFQVLLQRNSALKSF